MVLITVLQLLLYDHYVMHVLLKVVQNIQSF